MKGAQAERDCPANPLERPAPRRVSRLGGRFCFRDIQMD